LSGQSACIGIVGLTHNQIGDTDNKLRDDVADAYRMQADKIAYMAETGVGYTVEEGEG